MGCSSSGASGTTANGDSGGVRWASPCKVGARPGTRPTLAELRKLNQLSPEEGRVTGHTFQGDARGINKELRSGKSCLEVMEKNTVLVAVRIRPFNKREQNAGSAECVHCDGVTGITLRREGEKECKFAFDCIMRADTPQQDVFDRTGRPLLHKVLEGYNGCLFAYGQTGSGKTFTMQGESSNELQGIIPRLCKELFRQVEQQSASKNSTVSCSVLEIYNERLKDLQAQDADDLQIREDSALGGRGIFVDGLSEKPVRTAEEVLSLFAKGQARRAVGQTNMNEHSSRSHLVVTLRVTSCDVEDAEAVSLTSCKLNLVDLAGSERQKSTGAEGDRLKEGSQINLSLSALGNVINALTEQKPGAASAGGRSGRHIPYRDSKLTRLLQDSLGGSSYTAMICNVSPSRCSAEETLACLRFAERAKKIENKATVNRDPKNERILALLRENKALQATVARLEQHIVRLEEHYE